MDLMSLIIACVPGAPPATLYAVVQNESAGNANAININSKTYRLTRSPTTRAEALHILQELKQNRYGSYDVGLGQINSRTLARFGVSPEAALNPCINLKLSASVLADCYERARQLGKTEQHQLSHALSCYNTGSFTRGFSNGYVASVYRHAQTPPAAKNR
ncbi:MAG: lytic transglycosylase domain-containing protein [Paracoccaceae bacterium]